MADRRLAERLQPSLLDRLTDETPGTASEARDDRVIDKRELLTILRRDLGWLLNTTNLEQETAPDGRGSGVPLDHHGRLVHLDPDAHPNVATSVLNYGVRPVSGTFATQRRAEEIRDAIEEAIDVFEPRVSKGSLHVVLRGAQNARDTIITFDIRAEMWAQPYPENLYLRSEVDLTTGALTLESAG